MSSFVWATPSKAFEYYLDRAGRTDAELWNAVSEGHVRVRIMDVQFEPPQVRALLQLIHRNVAEPERTFELPYWMEVNVDDIERTLCGASLPETRRGRPRKRGTRTDEDYKLAVQVSKLIGLGQAASVDEAARKLIAFGLVKGASDEAKRKRIQRAYSRFFRHD